MVSLLRKGSSDLRKVAFMKLEKNLNYFCSEIWNFVQMVLLLNLIV